jgi:hypothetical protein
MSGNHHAEIDCILQVLRERVITGGGDGEVHAKDFEILEGEIQRLRRVEAAIDVLFARGRIPPKRIDPGFEPARAVPHTRIGDEKP